MTFGFFCEIFDAFMLWRFILRQDGVALRVVMTHPSGRSPSFGDRALFSKSHGPGPAASHARFGSLTGLGPVVSGSRETCCGLLIRPRVAH
jgi:hypothetical protein